MVGTSNLGSWNGHWSNFRGVDQDSIIKGPVLRALSTGCLLLGGCNQQKTKWSCLKTQSAGKAPTIWMSCKNGRSMRIKQWLLVEEPWLFELSGLLLAKPYPVIGHSTTAHAQNVGWVSLVSPSFLHAPCCLSPSISLAMLKLCWWYVVSESFLRLSKSPSKSWFQKNTINNQRPSKTIKDHQKPSRLMWVWINTY